jgi:RHH-type transcriptional regulator, proline utilization regulon repressor / proline dehydrogenase / delta 1-pyrroline-5-carboxylate dehydrogenase
LEDFFVLNQVNDAAQVALPVVSEETVNLETGRWRIYFYEEFRELIFPKEKLAQQLEHLIVTSLKLKLKSPFRREVIVEGMPLLIAIDPVKKGLWQGTRRLSRELSLIKMQQISGVDLSPFIKEKLELLKNHMESISLISPEHFPCEIEWITAQEDLEDIWNEEEFKDVHQEEMVILGELVEKTSQYRSSVFEKISDWGLGLTARYDLIRVHLLKFLALLPSLDHDKKGEEVKRNLLESLRRLKLDSQALMKKNHRHSRPLPLYLRALFSGAAVLAQLTPSWALARVIRVLVRGMARRFIAGESINTCHQTLTQLRRSSREATLDQLGELVVSSQEADEYFEKVLQLIHGLKQHIPKGEKNSAGILCAHVSIKVSALGHDFRPHAFEATYAQVAPRLRRILIEAAREEVFINIDAEHYHYRDVVLKIYGKVLLETPELKNYAQTGIVIQAYLKDGARHLKEVIELAKKRRLLMPIRLVKGAYWDGETIEADAHEFSAPQFLNKEESDLHFRALATLALQSSEWIQLAIGSHNLMDHAFVEALRKLRYPNAPVIEHQCLHMTYEALSHALARMGWPTRNYMPIGNLLVGMAYLVRRIMENSSQVGVLSIMRSHHKSSLMVSAAHQLEQHKKNHRLKFESYITQLKSDFAPVRPTRLFISEECSRLNEALRNWEEYFQQHQQVWSSSAGDKIHSNSRPELILGVINPHTPEDAQMAPERALEGLKHSWWAQGPEMSFMRVAVMLRASDLMLLRRDKLAALIMYEAGKTMSEALADVDEAIDFINFYAREEIKLQHTGQELINRGVMAVIAPWNFPLAIACGMSVAPLLAGNAVILKPAEQTPLIAMEFYHLLLEAGVPREIFHLLLGEGEVVGAPLVKHPLVAGVVFTGSKTVGQWIYQEAQQQLVAHYQYPVMMQKKVITEMGGKNAIIVTNNCEMDETVAGILYSALGHAGQKCSAASRVIVHHEVKELLVRRLKAAMQDLKVGSALDPATSINPLVTQEDQLRVRRAVEEAKDEVIRTRGKIHLDRSFEKLTGHSVGPVLLELSIHQAKKPDSWAQREIFGPVIHVMEYHSLIEAVDLFNSTQYALTGGIYAQSQDDIDFLLRFLRAGNLYVNRPNTGARVAIEPFGGFKLSGTGPKAGGEQYLRQFHYPYSPARPLETLATGPSLTWIKSSGYQLSLPRPSLISIPGRVERFSRLSTQFLGQYEVIMGRVNEQEKSDLAQFIHWITENLEHYLRGRHPNFTIPGQLSYDDKSLVKEAGLFVVVSDQPSLKALCHFLGALAVGSGISVAATTQESYQCWKQIVDMATRAGFSKMNLDIAMVEARDLRQLYQVAGYSFVYAEGLHQFHHELYQDIFAANALSEHMRSLHSECDGLVTLGPKNILDLFVWERSLAINTMRHGAPLEIQS